MKKGFFLGSSAENCLCWKPDEEVSQLLQRTRLVILSQVGRKGESLGFVRLAGGKRLGDTCYLRFAFTSFDEDRKSYSGEISARIAG